MAPPELLMDNTKKPHLRETSRPGMSIADDDSDEPVLDLEDDYLEHEESEEEVIQDADVDLYSDENMDEDTVMTNEEILSRVFDNDPDDIGYPTLLWYLGRPRKMTDRRVNQIRCRRCLRANLKCHPGNGPEGKCRECDMPSVNTNCRSDLRGAELYNGIIKR